jgi:hypothetical protein
MYCDDYLNSTDIRLNRNNAGKVPLYNAPQKFTGVYASTEKIYVFIYGCFYIDDDVIGAQRQKHPDTNTNSAL